MRVDLVKDRDRQQKALALRLEGKSYQTIADELGYYDRAAAMRSVDRLLNRTESRTVDTYRDLEDVRLTALWDKVWAAISADNSEPLAPLINAAIRVSERRSRLFGLDVAVQRIVVENDERGNVALERTVGLIVGAMESGKVPWEGGHEDG